MKNYTITVNGNVYEVTVEEGFTGAAKAAPAPAPKAAPAPRAAAPAPARCRRTTQQRPCSGSTGTSARTSTSSTGPCSTSGRLRSRNSPNAGQDSWS